jgi:hypothetical protein
METITSFFPLSEISPIWIPIFFTLGAFAIGIAAMILKSRERERAHRERMFLAEKGMPIPKELYEIEKEIKKEKKGDFRAARAWLLILGTTMVFVGIGVMIQLGVQDGFQDTFNGTVPLLIGVAFLVCQSLLAQLAKKTNGNNGGN